MIEAGQHLPVGEWKCARPRLGDHLRLIRVACSFPYIWTSHRKVRSAVRSGPPLFLRFQSEARYLFGIGVDYTIHVIHRYREEFSRQRDPERAAIRTLTTTGSALLGSALTTALGFGVLIASPLLASQQFGITATITIVYSLAVSILVVLPAMVVWGAYQNMRLRSMVEREWAELDEAIEGIHQQYEREHG